MGPSAASELPTIEKAPNNSDAMKGYETRTWADLYNNAQWPDLLRAVKSRLAEPATLEIRGGNINVVESAIRLYERNYHLLKMEAALLQQYRLKDPTIKQLLERCELIQHDSMLANQ